jgi:hypothetical protein
MDSHLDAAQVHGVITAPMSSVVATRQHFEFIAVPPNGQSATSKRSVRKSRHACVVHPRVVLLYQ